MCYCENEVFFIALPIIQYQSKAKIIPHTVFEIFMNSNSQYKAPEEIFTRAFLIKNHYSNLKLSIVELSSFIKCSPLKWKVSPKRCERPKVIKILHMARDTKKHWKGGKNEKQKV